MPLWTSGRFFSSPVVERRVAWVDHGLEGLYAAALHERTGPVFAMARGAAAVDPEIAVLRDGGQAGAPP